MSRAPTARPTAPGTGSGTAPGTGSGTGSGTADARAPRGLLPVLLTATFMTALDVFVVNVAIPSLQSDLGAGPAAVQWVVAGFGLAFAAGLITAGRLGDRHGRRRLFGLGLALFTLASAACGLAPTAGALVAARVAQGLAAALMGPQVLAILRTAYSGAAQARAFAMYGLTMGLGAVFGQLIGGVLIRADLFGLDWRSCFLLNLPVGLTALALVRRSLPESRAPHRPGLDPVGVALVTVALTGLVLPLIQGPGAGWPLWTWLCLGGATALLALFALHQHRSGPAGRSPLVDTRLFDIRRSAGRSFTTGLLVQLTFSLGQGSFFLVLALYLQPGRGLDALGAGLVFTAIGLGYLATSTAAHRVAARLGRQAIALGGLLMAAGLGLLGLAVHATGTTGSVWWLAPGLFVDGLGMGLVIAPVTSVVLAGVEPRLAGSAAGLVATVQQVAGALGVALIGILSYAADDPVSAFGRSLVALAVLELLLAGLVQLLPRRTR
ncbi:MFS transporter [Kitasatospora sp. NPDC056184]|uniref:MFS transporter n=1 Tax=Kitasatospora sp. NPDC056184 TaxID=3345738 RepID=UPI0035E1678E